jgi:hypothetical protein
VREFVADLSEITEVVVEGRLLFPDERYPHATIEQLRAAQQETQRMRERNGMGHRDSSLRGPRHWKKAEFKIGDNVVRALVPTKLYAAVLAGSNCVPPSVITINKRRYIKGGRDYPRGIDQRGRLRLGNLKKSPVSAISEERTAQLRRI